jgi:hypothetical protein
MFFKKSHNVQTHELQECIICFDEINYESKVECCGKYMHYSCLEIWRDEVNNCPHCRHPEPILNEKLPFFKKVLQKIKNIPRVFRRYERTIRVIKNLGVALSFSIFIGLIAGSPIAGGFIFLMIVASMLFVQLFN